MSEENDALMKKSLELESGRRLISEMSKEQDYDSIEQAIARSYSKTKLLLQQQNKNIENLLLTLSKMK